MISKLVRKRDSNHKQGLFSSDFLYPYIPDRPLRPGGRRRRPAAAPRRRLRLPLPRLPLLLPGQHPRPGAGQPRAQVSTVVVANNNGISSSSSNNNSSYGSSKSSNVNNDSSSDNNSSKSITIRTSCKKRSSDFQNVNFPSL